MKKLKEGKNAAADPPGFVLPEIPPVAPGDVLDEHRKSSQCIQSSS